jgi:putative iron-dependent peroxidase
MLFSTEGQERIIGRRKLSDLEMDDASKPPLAHRALMVIEENGREHSHAQAPSRW